MDKERKMTDKERLEMIKGIQKRIKEYQEKGQNVSNLHSDYVDWLIEQAEKAEQLELEINDWRAEVQKWQKFYEESEESHSETIELLHSTASVIKRYKQALEEISNADWNSEGLDAERELDKVTDVARKALEGEE